MHHRGPDEAGLWIRPGVALAHRRLRVLDLHHGQQPMLSDDGRQALVYNGEVYNYRALRDEYRNRGIPFDTDCDTEVVLKAINSDGADAIDGFNGMFAIAHWDDAERQLLWFEGTVDGATGRHLYRTGFDGSGLVCLTPGVGAQVDQLNADATFLIDSWSALDMPPRVAVRSGATGEVVKAIGQADRGAGEEKYAFSQRRRIRITARDGYELDASVMLPIGWQAGGSYPIYLPTYSGPDAPTVRDSWRYSTYEQFLAQEGFVILQVNVRSASGRGQQHTGMAYRQLGIVELRDLEDAVDHVIAEYGGDSERVAISGWSYGGFMAGFALTHSKKFALGLAGAGVYDWRLYDTIYTERYMRTPQENKQGYDATSVIKAAKNLHGHLVLLHGTMDDNVHMQNTMQLLWELQKAGKQNFELMVYPNSRHGLAGEVRGHSTEFQWLRLKKLLEG